MFDDLLEANTRHQGSFRTAAAGSAKHLAVVTCMDSRIDPLAALGLQPGDAKIIRNAGGRVTDDAMRSLVLATNLLGVDRICVIQHTDCAMAKATDAEIAAKIGDATGGDTSGMAFLAIDDQAASLRDDAAKVRAHPLIKAGTAVGAFMYDVATGELRRADS